MELFNGKANCASCHSGALISDQKFYNTSVPPNLGLSEDPLRQVTFRYLMRVKGLDPSIYNGLDRDPSRYLATQKPDDRALFRTPPLRYLKYTAPYMHNGIFYTLEEVVEFYNIGGTQDVFGTKSKLIKPLGLSRSEKAELVAFLEGLSGPEVKGEVPELPDYEIQQFPNSTSLVTAASLKGGLTSGVATAKPAIQPAKELSLALNPQGGGTTSNTQNDGAGLTMVPKDTGLARESSLNLGANSTPEDGQPKKKFMVINGERFVLVESGDTLRSLAKLVYGNPRAYTKIFEANRNVLRTPNAVVIGMFLLAPD